MNIKVEEKKGSPTRSYQTNNENIFNKVLRRYVEVGSQALFSAQNSLYKTRNKTRKSKGSEFMADVETVTKRVLSPAQWSTFCDIALREAGRPHGEIPLTDYARIVELTAPAYIKAELEPHNYFRFVRLRSVA